MLGSGWVFRPPSLPGGVRQTGLKRGLRNGLVDVGETETRVFEDAFLGEYSTRTVESCET